MTTDLANLLAYAAGDLPPKDRQSVEQRILGDPEAAEIVRLYQSLQRTVSEDDTFAPPASAVAWASRIYRTRPRPDRGPSVLGHLGAIIATLLDDSHLAPVALRTSSGSARQMVFNAGDIEAEIEVAPAPGDENAWRVIGQLSGVDSRAIIVAVIDGATRQAAETTTDEWGMFRLDVPASPLDLCVKLSTGHIIALPGIALEE